MLRKMFKFLLEVLHLQCQKCMSKWVCQKSSIRSVVVMVKCCNDSQMFAVINFDCCTVPLAEKLGLLCPFFLGGELGTHPTHCHLGRGLPTYQVVS